MKIKRFINIVIFIFIFALYFFTFLMIYDNFRERKLNSLEKSALELFENKIETKKDEIIPENINVKELKDIAPFVLKELNIKLPDEMK